MPLSIKDPETLELARKLAGLTGESLTAAVKHAIEDKFERLEHARKQAALVEELDRIVQHCASLPKQDQRRADEIIDYDENGLPG
jgi:antitoxin VapB